MSINYRKEFERMMREQTDIALATSSDNGPNVRIVNFYYDEQTDVLYFSSFADNQKVCELKSNNHVAFTTIPLKGEEHVRVTDARVNKSSVPINEIKDKFLEKMPEYLMSIPEVLEQLTLFELRFDKADVVVNFEHMGSVAL